MEVIGYVVERAVVSPEGKHGRGIRVLRESLHENGRWIPNRHTAIRYPPTDEGQDRAENVAASLRKQGERVYVVTLAADRAPLPEEKPVKMAGINPFAREGERDD